eukprot:8269559-Pyramimonas_sp.AAC.1
MHAARCAVETIQKACDTTAQDMWKDKGTSRIHVAQLQPALPSSRGGGGSGAHMAAVHLLTKAMVVLLVLGVVMPSTHFYGALAVSLRTSP